MNKLITVEDAEFIVKALKIYKILTNSYLVKFIVDVPLSMQAAMYLDEQHIYVNDFQDDNKIEIRL